MNSLNILIVDDNGVVRRLVRELLTTHGGWLVCGEASDGVEGVEKARVLRPDVVLMDISMPRMDGIDATGIIRREVPESKVIIVSQNDSDLVRKTAFAAGAKGIVDKSNISKDLLRTIENVVRNDGNKAVKHKKEVENKEGEDKASPQRAPAAIALLSGLENRERLTSHLAAIVNSSDDAIISKTLEGVITSWNNSAERLFGYTADEAIGQHITLIVPRDRWDEERTILGRLRQGDRVDHFETLRMRKDGTLVELSITISPVKDSAGRIVGASKVARDISDAKRNERALRDSEARLRTLSDSLEIQVRSRTHELEQRNAEILQQADQLRELSNRLLKTQEEERRHIARELHDSAGQLIAALGMNLAGINRHAGGNAALAEALRDTQNLVQQLNKEIRTTSYLLHPPLLDENGLAQAIQWYMQGLMERGGLEIELDVAEDFGRLPADLELAIFRIVQESLTNIHRHSGSKTATIRLSRGVRNIVLEIQDHGRGISPDKLAAIKAQRTGVGITGMRERVRNFAGEMDIQSNGNGATVSVTLPIPDAAFSEKAAILQPSEALE
jgi:PAS domain S-box-containing protein